MYKLILFIIEMDENYLKTSKIINWSYISQFHLNPPKSSNCLHRSIETQNAYDLHKQYLESINITISEYILSRYFISEDIIQQGWIIVRNDFPLNLEPNIIQLLLWIYPNKSFCDNEIYEIIHDYINNNLFRTLDWIYFRNIPKFRSVPEIEHYHIFILWE